MQLDAISKQVEVTAAHSCTPESSGSPGQILLRVCEMLDRADVRYCILHGYENYPRHIVSDVDILIDGSVTPSELAMLLRDDRGRIGADIVQCRGYGIVLAGKSPGSFLCLDFTVHAEANGLRFHNGSAVLAGRRRHHQFWVPEPSMEFGCYLARTIAKACLDERRETRLRNLYWQDAAGCERQIGNFWSGRNRELILSAVRSGEWSSVHANPGSIRAELTQNLIRKSPGAYLGAKLRRLLGLLRRVRQSEGISMVLLGPDGAGKSSVIEGLPPRVSDVFARSHCWGFAPPLHRLLRRRRRPTDQPHVLPPRTFLVSIVRAAYWFAYAIGGEMVLRITLARATLVLYDRHFVDILVDAKRYRYGGPQWVLSLIWRLIPKPDLIILLDAPAEVLQRRKQEVPFDETARQREAYLSLMRRVENGHVVDASQSRDHVADQVVELITRYLAKRARNRLDSARAHPAVPNRAIVDSAMK